MTRDNKFYAGYNTIDGTILYETIFVHRSDTADQMELQFGVNWMSERPYLIITECEVIVNEQNKNQGNSN